KKPPGTAGGFFIFTKASLFCWCRRCWRSRLRRRRFRFLSRLFGHGIMGSREAIQRNLEVVTFAVISRDLDHRVVAATADLIDKRIVDQRFDIATAAVAAPIGERLR